ncbi:MAG: trigger factor [Chloroflexi bacterium]|nr:trigger factor [Chloroflexota bacterium]
MKITQEEPVDRQTVLHIELEAEDLNVYLDRGYRRVVQRTMIPGFRKGKAPRRIVESYVGRESLINEVLEDMLPELTTKAIEAQELDAAGLPSIELLEFDPFTFKATVPLTPVVEVGPYRDIRISPTEAEVTEERIEERLEQMRQGQASWEPVDRPTQFGDLVTMSVVGKVGEDTIMDEKDFVFLLDEDGVRPLPGFSKEVVALKIDDSKDFALTIPDDIDEGNLAGKEASFSITVKEVKERIVPELDDEFAKGVGEGYESLAALREEVEKTLKEEAESKASQEHREQIVAALMEGASIQLPPLMMEHEIDHMEADRANMLARVGIRMGDYLRSIGKTEQDMRDELRDEARQRLERTFVLTKVAELEGLEVSEQEVDDRVKSILERAAQEQDEEDQSEEQEVSDEAKSSLRRMILAEKTLERLVAIAKGEAPSIEAAANDGDQPESKEENESTEGESDDTTA